MSWRFYFIYLLLQIKKTQIELNKTRWHLNEIKPVKIVPNDFKHKIVPNKGHWQRFVLALPASVIRNQVTWHNSLAVTISWLNWLIFTIFIVSFIHSNLRKCDRKIFKLVLKIFVLLWDLNPTPRASRAIAYQLGHTTRNHFICRKTEILHFCPEFDG